MYPDCLYYSVFERVSLIFLVKQYKKYQLYNINVLTVLYHDCLYYSVYCKGYL